MSDENLTPTEVRMCRRAFAAGARATLAYATPSRIDWTDEAEKRYPMPMVEVPREWLDSWGTKWRAMDEVIQYRHVSGDWYPIDCNERQFLIDSTRVLGWAGLLADPIERKPADEVER